MKYQPLSVRCECGQPTTEIRHVGLTPDHQLVLHWRCVECKRYAYILKSLAACWRDCPNEKDLDREAEFSQREWDADDRFLHDLGVKFQNDAV